MPTQSLPTPSGAPPACQPEACAPAGLTRPRYFAGQLLTATELTDEQHYLIERLRLHNRHLHGWGVVCGLAVLCRPGCAGWVTIQPGHAIDCCGNDIALNEALSFDVVGYLKQRARQLDTDCGPLGAKTAADPCAGPAREYCLVLAYAEQPARPIAAMVQANGTMGGHCEHSRTVESLRLDLVESLRLVPTSTPTLLERICACIEAVATNRVLLHGWRQLQREMNQELPDHGKLATLFCTLRDYIQELYTSSPYNVRCDICAQLHAIKLPEPPGRRILPGDRPRPIHEIAPERPVETDRPFETDRPVETDRPIEPEPVPEYNYYQQLWVAFMTLLGYVAQYLMDCICQALLVPCPACTPDDQIVLACLTLRGEAITQICNQTRRWHPAPLLTWRDELRALAPLLAIMREQGWLAKWDSSPPIEAAIERLCCADYTTLFIDQPPADLYRFREQLDVLEQRLQETYKLTNDVCSGQRVSVPA